MGDSSAFPLHRVYILLWRLFDNDLDTGLFSLTFDLLKAHVQSTLNIHVCVERE